MKKVILPPADVWPELCKRPVMDTISLDTPVRAILRKVREKGDIALYEFAEQYDKVTLSSLRVSPQEIADSKKMISQELSGAVAMAAGNIEKFHRSQLKPEKKTETAPGVKCWRKSVPVESVGLYIPGGSAPLFSTVLMLAIPAKIAGCKRIVICTPPDRDGRINPAILYAASLTGVTEIYKVGGAQAIAALAYGTETILKVYKIFGPGNQFVTKAKEIVQSEGTAIDMPAGPSEVLVIADKQADPSFVAADLLSQAEHGADSQVVLVTDDPTLIDKVEKEVEKQLEQLPRRKIAGQALLNSFSVVMPDLVSCIDFSNAYAPEHLIINVQNAGSLADKVINAGSVFLGKYSCESAGDYASGTNHTLPTNGFALSYSGVSTDSFVKKITFQELTREGIRYLGPSIQVMAEAEELAAHKNAVSIRLI